MASPVADTGGGPTLPVLPSSRSGSVAGSIRSRRDRPPQSAGHSVRSATPAPAAPTPQALTPPVTAGSSGATTGPVRAHSSRPGTSAPRAVKERLFVPRRDHLTPDWMSDLDQTSKLRCATVVRVSDTRWITDMTLAGAPPGGAAVKSLPEPWGQDVKREKQRRLEAKWERMRRNQARVLATALEEEQAKQELADKHLNGIRQQRLAYLTALAMRAD